MDQAQTVCTADTQSFVAISTTDKSNPTSGSNAITSNVESTTDIILGLYNNGAIERGSVELHWDSENAELSTIDFGTPAPSSDGWFGME